MKKSSCAIVVGLVLSGCTETGEVPTFFSLLPESGMRLNAPANLPHEGFEGDFWIDRKGCTFIRTGSGQWVPRVDESGRQFCDPDQAYELPDNLATKNPNVPDEDIVRTDPRTGIVTTIMAPRAIPTSYVRVAVFDTAEDGRKVQTRFREQGFPVVGYDKTPPAGKALTVVLGPFTVESALADALETAQKQGYPDAYTFAN